MLSCVLGVSPLLIKEVNDCCASSHDKATRYVEHNVQISVEMRHVTCRSQASTFR